MADFSVPGPANSQLGLAVDSGHPLFIVGRNGSGKSALMHWLRRHSLKDTIYLPGSRTALFDGESLSLTPESRRMLTNNLGIWDSNSDARWRSHSGNQRNEKAIHDLTAAENQYKTDCATTITRNLDPVETAAAIAKLQARESPLDRVNQLLEQANIPVQMLIAGNELKATSGGNIFSYARMSDGERIALVLIAEVISAKPSVLFLIDEPELHLHRLIVVPLITILIRSRPDCAFIVSTHELDLPKSIAESRLCIMRSVTWKSDGEVEHWDFDVVDRTDDLPEGLVTDILGSRRRVLFTEGAASSLDVPMYSVLFPKVSIRPKASCKGVQHAVIGIGSTTGLHHTEAFGLIDNDGMPEQAIVDLQAQNVYPLPLFSVESLYYDADVLTAVAVRQAMTHEADEQKQADLSAALVADVLAKGMAAAAKPQVAEHLAGRLAERQMRDALLEQLPKRDQLIAAPLDNYPDHRTIHLSSGACATSSDGRRPGPSRHHSPLPGPAFWYPQCHSEGAEVPGRGDYEKAAVARISLDRSLRDALLRKLTPLSNVLNA